MQKLEIKNIALSELKAYENNPRRITEEAVNAVASSIKEFGFKVPIIIDTQNVIVAGHTRVKAAEKLGLIEVPCIIADDLTPEQIKAFRLIDNKTSELSGWDFEKLDLELEELKLDFDMNDFGFDINFDEDEVDPSSFFTRVDPVNTLSSQDQSKNQTQSQLEEQSAAGIITKEGEEREEEEEKFIICPECGARIEI